MNKTIRIGTRESRLALWQAGEVATALSAQGFITELLPVKSDGDLDLVTPLYETGVQGIFTRSLDAALLAGKIDIAVHSYKDVPVALAKGLEVAAVLKRGNPFDILVAKDEKAFSEINTAVIQLVVATSSIRRKAQWLYRYKNSQIENIRGNVQTRLQKLKNSHWHGAIFAAAGLERLNIQEIESGPQLLLDWMLPAPAQGAIVVVCRENEQDILDACRLLNDNDTRTCTHAEREFLRLLQGGCSTPISAYARLDNDNFNFQGNITAPDGSESKSVSLQGRRDEYTDIVKNAADMIITSPFIHQLIF
jgi:hydroxymethylbilane synthase